MKSISGRGGNIRLGSDPCGGGINDLAGFGVPDALYPSPVALEVVPGIVQAAVTPISDVVHLPMAEIVGRVLAADLRASEALPGFEQSAVDGYAYFGVPSAAGARIAGIVRAGEASPELPLGTAFHVMTGAPVPQGADRVAPQESCRVIGDRVLAPLLAPGANIRRMGEDVERGDLLARAGARLDARHVALFAATGQGSVPCLRRIKVALVATGDELVEATPDPARGQIRDSNSPMLAALLSGTPDVEVARLACEDDADALTELFGKLAGGVDVIVTTGGMSFGLEDHVRDACIRLGGAFSLEAVAMKPGKPVGLACLGRSVLLGLPGNPFAALVAFLLVGREVLARLRGSDASRWECPAQAGFALDRRPGRAEFFPARVLPAGAQGLPVLERLGKGGSARLAPLVAADGLGMIAASCTRIEHGDLLSFRPFEAAFRI